MDNLRLPLADHFDPELTDKNTIHSYLPIYENLLKELVEKKGKITLWEIGIQRGGSIMGWIRALPGSEIVGVDCQKTVRILAPNYKEYIMNAYEEEFMVNGPQGQADMIVEDGSHAFNDLVFVCRCYPQLLNEGGILVIEDIPDVNWIPKLVKMLPPDFNASVADLREVKGRWDDVMLIIRKNI